MLFKFSGPGDLLGGLVTKAYRASAQAMGESLVAFIDNRAAVELMASQPRLAMEVNRRIGEDRDLLAERLLAMACGDVRHRLAWVLLELGERHGAKGEEGILIDLPLSQQDLADMVGASREKVNRKLRRLADQGLIRVDRCRITVRNVEALQRLG